MVGQPESPNVGYREITRVHAKGRFVVSTSTKANRLHAQNLTVHLGRDFREIIQNTRQVGRMR